MKALVVLLSLLAIAHAGPLQANNSRSQPTEMNNNFANEDAEPVKYSTEYHVYEEEKNLNFGHKESREGAETKGEYFVLLPGCNKMTVTYTANEMGYMPKIKFERVANCKLDDELRVR